jgi:hypothetical protein
MRSGCRDLGHRGTVCGNSARTGLWGGRRVTAGPTRRRNLMPGSQHGNPLFPPDWNESDSFRETMLIFIDDPASREAIREAGRVLYDLAVEASQGDFSEPSMTRTELRAVQAELRYLQGYLDGVKREPEESSLSADDAALCRFAGRLGIQLGALTGAIERTIA